MSAGPDTRKPAWVERVPAWIDGRPTSRLIFIFTAVGCSWGRRPDGGCTNCGFRAVSTDGVPVAPEDLVAQIETLFADPRTMVGVGEIDLYNSGSFLADNEIPAAVRTATMRRLAGTGVRRVLVESRPELVRAERIAALRAELRGDQELEVGIGLESADDHVRDVLVHKGFGRAEFEEAVRVLGAAGARLLTYVLLKPLGLEERAAVEDSVATARWVFEVAARHAVPARVALQPVFVAPGTMLDREHAAGRYQPPTLWSVVEVVQRTHAHGELLVGLSDEGLSPHRVPAGCETCTPRLRKALADYNRTRDLAAFDGLDCGCRDPRRMRS